MKIIVNVPVQRKSRLMMRVKAYVPMGLRGIRRPVGVRVAIQVRMNQLVRHLLMEVDSIIGMKKRVHANVMCQ